MGCYNRILDSAEIFVWTLSDLEKNNQYFNQRLLEHCLKFFPKVLVLFQATPDDIIEYRAVNFQQIEPI